MNAKGIFIYIRMKTVGKNYENVSTGWVACRSPVDGAVSAEACDSEGGSGPPTVSPLSSPQWRGPRSHCWVVEKE